MISRDFRIIGLDISGINFGDVMTKGKGSAKRCDNAYVMRTLGDDFEQNF